MPACAACRMLQGSDCRAFTIAQQTLGREISPPPIGACMIPIVEGYLAHIQPGMRVLEIGCGTWDWVLRRCQAVGAHYEAIDTAAEYSGKPVIATRIENLA